MEVDVINTKNEKVGKIALPDAIFATEVKEALLWEQVKAQRASARRGTHDTKTRGDVSGGGIKPYKQKGTGRARQGSSRAPNHVGGGKVFGPHPRDYSYRLPRSARKSALRSVLSLKAKEHCLVVLDAFTLDKPKTKAVEAFVKALGGKSALIVDVENGNLSLSARNFPQAKYVRGEAINVYDVLDHERLVLTKAAVDAVVKKAMSTRQAAAAAA